MRIHKSLPHLDRNDIKAIEGALEVKLPQEYIDFLMTKHVLTIYTYWFKVGERDFVFSNFLPYAYEEHIAHLVDFNLQIREGIEGFIIIARGHAQDAYLLKVTDDQYGSVFYLRLDYTIEEGLLFVASSFNQFCKLLDSYDGYEGPEYLME